MEGVGRVGSARMAVRKASGSELVGMGAAEIVGDEAAGGTGEAGCASSGLADGPAKF